MRQKRERSYSRYTKDAAKLLGQHIHLGRKERALTEKDLAERAGISRATLQKIERGDLKCEIGLVLELATLVGVKLFGVDQSSTFSASIEKLNDKIALLPKMIRKKEKALDDAF